VKSANSTFFFYYGKSPTASCSHHVNKTSAVPVDGDHVSSTSSSATLTLVSVGTDQSIPITITVHKTCQVSTLMPTIRATDLCILLSMLQTLFLTQLWVPDNQRKSDKKYC
jgi:hypothetical protein